MNNQNDRSDGIFNIRYDVLICLFLVIATLAVYWQISYHEFVNFDDSSYILQNKQVQKGLTLESISWAFSFNDIAYWHPLTWISHMLDCQIYGLIPGMHHRTSLIFHIVNSILLFFVLQKMTGALWRSAFVAALFAMHPLNVESVAWVAERKNVLSAFFWMLTMLAYVHYTTRPSLYRYLLALLLLMFGLMAKPMLVTLPFVLLLLDYWPFERFRHEPPFNLILEKIPFFALSAVSVYISSLSVKYYGIVVSTELVPMQLRIANALLSYVKYIEKMIWPKNLAIFYPFPDTLPIWQILGAGLFLASISFLVLLNLRKKPYLCMGWLWFLGTLIPVIGLKQAGLWPAMADRWAYVPLVGIFIILSWGGSDLLKKWTHKNVMSAILAIAVLLALTVLSFMQASHWKNSITLFENAIKVTENNCMAHNNLGIALLGKGELNKAIFHYKKALNIKPDISEAIKNLGVALTEKGNFKEAAQYFSKALVINPEDWDSYYKLGGVLAKRGKFNEAIRHLEEVIKINPGYAPVYNEIGIIFAQKGKLQKSNDFFSKAIQLEPDCKEARDNLLILKQLMQHDEK